MTPHLHTTISVGVRELHNRTSQLMKAVAEGAELEVTNHGKVVGRMVPVAPDDLYQRLKRDGMIREPKAARTPLPPPIKLAPGVTVSDLIKDQRR
ncbi:MAG: type II toxin-antitoxin system prevent-host-death family antitoxin [Thermoleophilaceae bacterium]|nr:type II toxin-antitoxin system prevent-host-death family antitoxin [Thermoleophilaceae bacterium]